LVKENMVYCRQCGKQIDPEDKFCRNCGTSEGPASGAKRPVKGPQPAAVVAGTVIGVIIFAVTFYAINGPESGKAGPSGGGCNVGYAPATNDHSKCCSVNTPYYWSSDGKCHKYQKCSQGYAPATNNPSKCCSPNYPYYWSSDGKCHTTKAPSGQSDANVIAEAKTLVREYQVAVANGDWDTIVSIGQELEEYIETYYDVLITDIYFEENMDDLIDMIDGNEVHFEEVCHSGGGYTACTTPISDTATLACQEAEQRFKQDYMTVSPEAMTVSYLRSQVGLIDDVVSKCIYIRSSDQIEAWNSARNDVYASLTQLEQTCNSMSGYKPTICN